MVIYNSPYETESKICTHFEEKECQSAFKKLVAITEAYDEDTQFALVSGRTISLEYDRPLIVQSIASIRKQKRIDGENERKQF